MTRKSITIAAATTLAAIVLADILPHACRSRRVVIIDATTHKRYRPFGVIPELVPDTDRLIVGSDVYDKERIVFENNDSDWEGKSEDDADILHRRLMDAGGERCTIDAYGLSIHWFYVYPNIVRVDCNSESIAERNNGLRIPFKSRR